MDAAKKAIDDGHHGYVLSNGILECRQAVTRKIKKLYNQDIDPERIMIMPGGKPTMIMQYNVLVNLVQKLFIQHQHFQFMSL